MWAKGTVPVAPSFVHRPAAAAGSLEKELSAKPTEDGLPQYDNLRSWFEAECPDNDCHSEPVTDVTTRKGYATSVKLLRR
jgi:hypothetical protein